MMIGIIRKGVLWVSRKLDLVVHLTAEKLVLRQQLLVLKRGQKRPRLARMVKKLSLTLKAVLAGAFFTSEYEISIG